MLNARTVNAIQVQFDCASPIDHISLIEETRQRCIVIRHAREYHEQDCDDIL